MQAQMVRPEWNNQWKWSTKELASGGLERKKIDSVKMVEEVEFLHDESRGS